MIRAAAPLLLAIIGTTALVWLVGDSPTLVFKVLLTGAFGTLSNFSTTLFYATPYLFSGAAVWLALQGGLFNIGAEGQISIGAVAAIATALFCTDHQWPAIFAVPLSLMASLLAAGSAGALLGYLRARRNVHEVLSSILFNFIAAAFANWAVLSWLKNPETQSLETRWIAKGFRIPKLALDLTSGLPLAIAVTVVIVWFVKKTYFGYRLRAVGHNPKAAQTGLISVTRMQTMALALSGAVAGIVGFQEIFFSSYRLVDAFSPGYGFAGLAIALLSRGSATGLVLAALFFGAVRKGSMDLDIETEKITRDLALVIQSILLVALAIQSKVKDGGKKPS